MIATVCLESMLHLNFTRSLSLHLKINDTYQIKYWVRNTELFLIICVYLKRDKISLLLCLRFMQNNIYCISFTNFLLLFISTYILQHSVIMTKTIRLTSVFYNIGSCEVLSYHNFTKSYLYTTPISMLTFGFYTNMIQGVKEMCP